jgi:AcrR family transcriptional regulator
MESAQTITRDLRTVAIAELSARDRILKTAILLFNEHGVHTTGIDKIISQSGVAKMTFYKHFPSKNDLILAFLDYRDAVQFERLKKYTVHKTKDARLQILGIFDALEEWFEESDYRGCAFTRGLADFGDHPQSEAFKSVQKHFTKWNTFIETPLLEFTSAKNVKIVLPQIMSLIIGSIIMATANSDPSIAKLNKKLVKSILDSL